MFEMASLVPLSVLLRAISTDHAPPPRSRTLTVTDPVKPDWPVVCVSTASCRAVS